MSAYDDNNIFARILRGEIPGDKVYEDEHVLAIRDKFPKAPVHVLVMPKGKYMSMTEFTQNAGDAEIVAFNRAVGKVVKQMGLAEGGYRAIVNSGAHGGQEVPHLHMHILAGKKLGPMISEAA